MALQGNQRQIAGRISASEDAVALHNPLITSYDGGHNGSTIGTVIETTQNYDLDLEELVVQDRIGSKQMYICGDVGSRKTTLAKQIALNESMKSHGGRRARIEADDVNSRNGVPEWTEFAKAFNCKPISPDEPINPFDTTFGLTFSEQMDTATEFFEHANNGLQTAGNQEYILQICMARMLTEFADIASLDTLEEMIARFDKSDFDTYRSVLDADFSKGVELEKHPDLQDRVQKLLDRPAIYLEDDMKRDASIMQQRLARIMKGNFGQAFGGTKSPIEKLQQRVVIRGYTGLNDRTIALRQSFFWRLKRSAIDRLDHRFIAQVGVHDENYKMFRYMSYAVNQGDHMKQNRNTYETEILLSHRPRDYRTVGQAGSQQREIAENMISEVDVICIGQMKKRDVKDLQEFIDLSNREVKGILAQRKGQFSIKIRQEPIVRIDTNVNFTEQLARVSRSTGALEASMVRDKAIDEQFYVPEAIGE